MRTGGVLGAGLLLASLCACASAGTQSRPDGEAELPVISGDKYAGIIVPASHVWPSEWTPSEAEVIAAEPKIQECILAEPRGLSQASLQRFFRQYSGVEREGRRTLRVDLFDSRVTPVKQLRRPVIRVDGSGDDYLIVEYDIQTERCNVHRF